MQMSATSQSELPLRVAICAWCKPKNRSVDLGVGLGSISHGICPQHLKELRLELQMKKNAGNPAHATAARARQRRGAASNHPELNYQA
jgi:hypothetical protein